MRCWWDVLLKFVKTICCVVVFKGGSLWFLGGDGGWSCATQSLIWDHDFMCSTSFFTQEVELNGYFLSLLVL